jgi:hypothetical protein
MTEQEKAMHFWLPVLGRSLAFLCVHSGDGRNKTLADKAMLLEALGLERAESAAMLGTTYGSITETLSKLKRRKKGGRRHGGKSKASKKNKK